MSLQESGFTYRIPVCAAEEHCPQSLKGVAAETVLLHVPVKRLSSDELCYIPAGFVHLHFEPQPPEPVITLPISTGFAFDPNLVHALWRGLCEVAERDSLMTAWLLKSPLPEIMIDPRLAPFRLGSRVERVKDAGMKSHFFDMSSEFPAAAVLSILLSDRFPFITVGASCSDDPVSALCKSLDEAVGMRLAVKTMSSEGEEIPDVHDFRWLVRLDQHATLYASGRCNKAFEFLFGSSRQRLPLQEFARHGEQPHRTISVSCGK
jgi:thiazole/oxazole-forming peptide maturase SagD family component